MKKEILHLEWIKSAFMEIEVYSTIDTCGWITQFEWSKSLQLCSDQELIKDTHTVSFLASYGASFLNFWEKIAQVIKSRPYVLRLIEKNQILNYLDPDSI